MTSTQSNRATRKPSDRLPGNATGRPNAPTTEDRMPWLAAGLHLRSDEEWQAAEREADHLLRSANLQATRSYTQPCELRRASSMQSNTSASWHAQLRGMVPDRAQSACLGVDSPHTQCWNETEQWADGLLHSLAPANCPQLQRRTKRQENILEMQSATSQYLSALMDELNVAHPKGNKTRTGEETPSVPNCREELVEAEMPVVDMPSGASTPASLKGTSAIMCRLALDSPSPLSACSTVNVNEHELRHNDRQLVSRQDHVIASQEYHQDADVLYMPDVAKCSEGRGVGFCENPPMAGNSPCSSIRDSRRHDRLTTPRCVQGMKTEKSESSSCQQICSHPGQPSVGVHETLQQEAESFPPIARYGTIAEPRPNREGEEQEFSCAANGLVSMDLDWTIAHPSMRTTLRHMCPSSPVAKARLPGQHVQNAFSETSEAGEEQCGAGRAMISKEIHQAIDRAGTSAPYAEARFARSGLQHEGSALDASSLRSGAQQTKEETMRSVTQKAHRPPVLC